MRKLCLLLVCATALPASISTVAATDELLFGPMTPARVSGAWVYGEDLSEGRVDQTSEFTMSLEDARSVFRVTSNDPRFGGVAEVTGGWRGWWPPALVTMVEQDWVVTDAQGSWTGSTTYLASMADGDPINAREQVFLDGSGAYEGLTTYVVIDSADETLVGAILPDEMPELPADWLEIYQSSAEEGAADDG